MSTNSTSDTHRESLAHKVDQKQDEVLRQLDELDAQIDSLLEEFTNRLRGEKPASEQGKAVEKSVSAPRKRARAA